MNNYKRRLLESLIKVLSQIRDQTYSIRENQETHYNAEEQHWNRPVRTEPQLPEEIHEHYRAENRDRPSKTFREWTLLIVQGAAVLVALAYVILTYKTMREIQKQTPKVSQAAEAASGSAITAQNSLGESRINFIRDERPYLTVHPRGVFPNPMQPNNVEADVVARRNPDGTINLGVAIEINDTGRTAGIEVSTTATTSYFNIAAVAQRQARSYIPRYQPGTTFITPNSLGIVPHSAQVTATAEQAENFTRGIWALFVVGSVRYHDLFSTPATTAYETDYCYQIIPEGLSFGTCPWEVDFHNSLK